MKKPGGFNVFLLNLQFFPFFYKKMQDLESRKAFKYKELRKSLYKVLPTSLY
jgi:hypothetical protein